MNKAILAVAIMLMSVSVYAGDTINSPLSSNVDNSTTNQGGAGGFVSDVSADGGSVFGSGNSANFLDQNASNQGVNVDASQENDTLVLAPPSMSVSGQRGQSGAGVSTPFGGFNWVDDAEHTQMRERFEVIKSAHESGLISDSEANVMARETFLRFMDATEPRRWLGVGPVARGFNLLAWNSRDRVAELEKKSPVAVKPKTPARSSNPTVNFVPNN